MISIWSHAGLYAEILQRGWGEGGGELGVFKKGGGGGGGGGEAAASSIREKKMLKN